jgi:hypothetical protein
VRRAEIPLLAIAACVAALAAAGCGGSDESTWTGPPPAADDGSVPVEGFVAYQDSVDEAWERSAVLVAARFLNLGEVTANKSVRSSNETDDSTEQTVTVELEGLHDGTARDERWTLTLEPAGETLRLASATRVQRCLAGGGHEDFSPELCAEPDES